MVDDLGGAALDKFLDLAGGDGRHRVGDLRRHLRIGVGDVHGEQLGLVHLRRRHHAADLRCRAVKSRALDDLFQHGIAADDIDIGIDELLGGREVGRTDIIYLLIRLHVVDVNGDVGTIQRRNEIGGVNQGDHRGGKRAQQDQPPPPEVKQQQLPKVDLQNVAGSVDVGFVHGCISLSVCVWTDLERGFPPLLARDRLNSLKAAQKAAYQSVLFVPLPSTGSGQHGVCVLPPVNRWLWLNPGTVSPGQNRRRCRHSGKSAGTRSSPAGDGLPRQAAGPCPPDADGRGSGSAAEVKPPPE